MTETALWHSQALMSAVKRAEVVIDRGEGAYLWDESGRKLLDAPAGLWYCNVGHGRKEIADAVAGQMTRLETYHTFNQYANRPAIELAERVAGLSGLPAPKVFLTSGGSDAIDTAGKLARRYWSALGKPGKTTIVTRDRGYHGLHTLGTSIVGLEINQEGIGPLVRETVRVPTNDAAAFEATVREIGADSVAAFFAEPIVGTGGVIHPAPGYFEDVQRICRENDILFVADEVVCGFGRTGEWFGTHRFGLEPDMMVFAKGVTSGYLPLGGVVASERVAAPFWEDGSELIFRHGLTYAGHATVCAAALANLDILERESLAERVRELEGVLAGALRPLEAMPFVREVRTGIGFLTGILVEDHATALRVSERCLDKGVLMRALPDAVLHVSPPLVVTEDDIRLIAEALAEALAEEAAAAAAA
jgi:adenosylmethionine-8-amino-7-oxononanoate aminotransferase